MSEEIVEVIKEAESVKEEKEEITESMNDYAKELEASFRTINEGDIIKGTVIDISEEEVTLDLKYYTQGIIKVEDLSDDPHFSVFDDIKMDQEIEATVVKVDDGHGNILLSKKEANATLAWDVLKAKRDNKENITVQIAEIVKGGAVAYVEDIRGFIPASQLALSYVEDLEEYANKTLTVRVTDVDESKQRVILSAKEILKEEKADMMSRKIMMVETGSILEGTVESLRPFGAFVDLGDGLSGLVHISQICEKRIKSPSEVLKEGQKVNVKVLGVKDGKISLSIKDVEGNEQVEEIEDYDISKYSSGDDFGTSLGSLFANIKL